jgi:hypothetical protein
MKKLRAEDVLSHTFIYLEKVLNGEIADQDGFIGRTAMLAESESKRFARGRAERNAKGDKEK